MNPNLIGLIRMSTAEQAKEGHAGILRQQHDIDNIQRMTGANIIRTLIVIESGATVMDNQKFQEIFEALADPKVDGVACSHQDRLSRPENFKDFALFDHFKLNGKRIYTPSGVTDPGTINGWIEVIFKAMFAGMERQEIRRRTMGAKERHRSEGRCPNPINTLPRGVLYSKTAGFSYDLDPNDPTPRPNGRRPGDALVIPVAFDLLANRKLSWEAIAETVGNGWSANGFRGSLRNPIWIGIRRYREERTGPFIFTGKIGENGERRKYRKTTLRSQILEKRVIEKGLIPEELFWRAQEVIEKRTKRFHGFRKTEGSTRFLCGGCMMICNCGNPYYTQALNNPKHKDHYYCRKRCGAPNLQRELLDGTIIQVLSHHLLQPAVLQQILQAAPKPSRDDQSGYRAAVRDLDKQEDQLVTLFQTRRISLEKFDERQARIAKDRAGLALIYPTVQIQATQEDLARALITMFVELPALAFQKKRELLQRAVQRIMISGRTVISLTLSGGFLGETSLKLHPRSWARAEFNDILIQFPQPIEIPARRAA